MVAHYMPYPDQANRFPRHVMAGACLPDIVADIDMTSHKTRTLDDKAELGVASRSTRKCQPGQLEEFAEMFRRDHEGPENAGKTLFLGGGADVKTVAQTFQTQLS